MNKSKHTDLAESKKKKSKSMKHKKKHKTSLNGNEDSDDLSPNKEIHSISHYMNDRPEMLEQMFSTMSEEKLRAMLPPLLKDETMDDLRANCLEALLGMSSKRIKSVINGDDLGSQSSDTDDSSITSSSDDTDEDRAPKHAVAPVVNPKNAPKATKTKTDENEGQSLLEIVELQLRARAIRAALEHQCASDPPSPDVETEPSTNQEDPIDVPIVAIADGDDRFKKPVKKEAFDDYDDCVLSKIQDTNSGHTKDDGDGSVKRIDETVVFSKGSVSGPSKRNVVVIGPSKKSKNKIVYSKKSIRVIDTSKSAIELEKENGDALKMTVVEGGEQLEAEVSSIESSKLSISYEEASTSAVLESDEIETQTVVEGVEEEMTETRTESASDEDSKTVEEDPVEESWVGRWLQQPENQAAKKTSKIITSIKQKLRVASKKNAEAISERKDPQPSEAEEPLLLLGTVDEYDLLPSTAVVSNVLSPSTSKPDDIVVEGTEDMNITPDVPQSASPSTNGSVEATGNVREVLALDPSVTTVVLEPKLGVPVQVDESDAVGQNDELEIHYRETEDEMQQ